jgi:hypothetical protein
MRRPKSSGRPRRRLPTVLLAGVATVGLLAAACSDASSAPTEAAAARPIAENVDIGGGRTIYVECHGEGAPTVLLLSGGGTASDLWHAADQDPPNV